MEVPKIFIKDLFTSEFTGQKKKNQLKWPTASLPRDDHYKHFRVQSSRFSRRKCIEDSFQVCQMLEQQTRGLTTWRSQITLAGAILMGWGWQRPAWGGQNRGVQRQPITEGWLKGPLSRMLLHRAQRQEPVVPTSHSLCPATHRRTEPKPDELRSFFITILVKQRLNWHLYSLGNKYTWFQHGETDTHIQRGKHL